MEDLPIRDDIIIPGWEMWFTADRSGGPGGQHANKASTQITIYWNIEATTALSPQQKKRVVHRLRRRINQEGQLTLQVGDTRSQHQNRKIARDRLKELVEDALKVRKRRIRTRPPKSAKRRRVQNKRHRGRVKELRQSPDRHKW